MSSFETVCRLEQARFDAMINRRFDDLADLFDERLIYVHSTGAIDGKASFLEGLAHSNQVDAIDLRDRKHVENNDEIILTQTLDVRMTKPGSGEILHKSMVASSVWRRADGQWRLVLMHSTPA